MITIDPRPPIFKNRASEVIVVFLIMMCQLLNQSSTTQTMPAMNAIAKAFNTDSFTDKIWFQASFSLTSGAFILVSGKFGDLYGLKKVLLCGTGWTILWTLVTGLSFYTKSVVFFCICRAMHGVGLAFMLPLVFGIAGNIYPVGQRKAIVFCLAAACAPIGATFGVVFAGLIATKNALPWCFYASTILLCIIGVAIWFFIPEIQVHHHDFEDDEKPTMDWIGAVTSVSGLTLINFSWNQCGSAGWSSPYIIVLFIVGIFLLVGFFYHEKRIKHPLLPKEVLNYNVGLVLSTMAFGWGSFSIWGFYYFSFVLNLRHYTPVMSGITYFTLMTFGIIATFVVSIFIRKIRPSYLLVSAASSFLIGIAMLSATPVHQSYFHMVLPQMIILSFGMDLSFPSASLILSDSLPKKHQGMASSLVTTTVNYSMSIAVGFAGLAEVKTLQRNPENILGGYRAAMYVGVGMAGVGVLISLVFHLLSYLKPHDDTLVYTPTDEEKSNTPSYDTGVDVTQDINSEK